MAGGQQHRFNELLPKCGLVYSEKGTLSEVLAKPKLLPLKVRIHVGVCVLVSSRQEESVCEREY